MCGERIAFEIRFVLWTMSFTKQPAIFFGQPCAHPNRQQYLLNDNGSKRWTRYVRNIKLKAQDWFECFPSAQQWKEAFCVLSVNSTENIWDKNMKTKWTQRRRLYVTCTMVLRCACLIRCTFVLFRQIADVAYSMWCCCYCCRYKRRTVCAVHCWLVFILNAFHTFRRLRKQRKKMRRAIWFNIFVSPLQTKCASSHDMQ